MINGRKPAHRIAESDIIPGSRTWLALLLVVLVAAFTWWLLTVAPPEPPAGMDYW